MLYGIGDFAGGIASRRTGAMTVLLWSYPVGAALMTLLLPLFPGDVDGRVLLFGILGGAAGQLGVVLMYSLMTVAPINVISPITAVLAAIVPVLVGVGLGERPQAAAWLGIVVGLGAVVLVSRTSEDNPHGRMSARILALAFLSGLGFGLYFVLLARAGDDSGLLPLVISRYASALLIVPLAAARGALRTVHGRSAARAHQPGTVHRLSARRCRHRADHRLNSPARDFGPYWSRRGMKIPLIS